MVIEFTCLSCNKAFCANVEDLPRTDYLSCADCGRPVPVDLLDALKRVGESLVLNGNSGKGESFWHIRFKEERIEL